VGTSKSNDHLALRAEAVAYFGGRMKPFTQKELCQFLGVSRATLLRWREQGRLRAFTADTVIRYHVEDVYVCLMRQTA
jgi:excisionase family DNA binding protein